ncbi:TPA: glycosyltransferase [Vibrio vulnificus]|uniref:glycosyltransferase n=1 Tax=Vibrio vulnificus TaxID=672 RepID=UPI0021D904BD|nr:glycosyltransferase [Vibrio vulnificus]HDY7903960.1 glycosyltransferase [Vibrio vulnificus]HDY7926743.1 glycosyltransferase [Vibrio vulnificus]
MSIHLSNRVAVLLAAYNGEAYLREQIETIINQVDVSVDIFISLDTSTDNSLELLRSLSSKHTNIKLLEPGKTFGSAGQNFFHLLMDVDFSSYSYVAFADQDDIWLENKLCKAIEEIESRHIDGYSSNVIAFWEDGAQRLIGKSSPQVEFDYLFESAGPGCTFVMTLRLATAIKHSLNTNKKDVSKLWLHDWFCYAFARKNQFEWYIDPNSFMFYRQHSANSVGANSGFKSLSKRIEAVFSGDAFEKVIAQADFLGASEKKPIQYIMHNSFPSVWKLLWLSSSCRRKGKDKILFFMAVALSFIKGGLGWGK